MAALLVYWPALFAVGTILLMCLVELETAATFPPKLDLSGAQALIVVSSPYFLCTAVPVVVGLVWLHFFARGAKLDSQEHMSMVWWLVNAFWFHMGCDVLSGYFQVMPVLTELYMHMSPAHKDARWSPSRAALDSGYLLELVIEAPLALLVLLLFWRRHPGRFTLEVCAASIQLAGTVTYYAPAVAKGETHCWLSWADRSCGSVWIIFPALLVWRHVLGAGKKPKRS